MDGGLSAVMASAFARCHQMNNQTVYKHSVKAGCLLRLPG